MGWKSAASRNGKLLYPFCKLFGDFTPNGTVPASIMTGMRMIAVGGFVFIATASLSDICCSDSYPPVFVVRLDWRSWVFLSPLRVAFLIGVYYQHYADTDNSYATYHVLPVIHPCASTWTQCTSAHVVPARCLDVRCTYHQRKDPPNCVVPFVW